MTSSATKTTISEQDKEPTCKYTQHTCLQSPLMGYTLCIHHILEDKAAPYKQCAYMTKAGRRCMHAAPKLEKKESFCFLHNRKSLLSRQRLTRKRRPGETGESLLEELVAFTSAVGSGGHDGGQGQEHPTRRGKMYTDSVASRALEYASSSDSDSEFGPYIDETWQDDGDSDAESIDSDQEDLLKYAGVYTSEEVAQIFRDKLIRLQALYIDQFKRLKHVLLTKRRQYLRASTAEKEIFGSIKLYKKDPAQRERYNKLRAMQQYHRRSGKEALLQQKSTQRRIQASGPMSPALPGSAATAASTSGGATAGLPCTFLDDGLRCNATVVPLSSFCQRHILHDSSQLLYRPCPFADSQCGRPVPTLLNTEFCSLHQPLASCVKSDPSEVKPEDIEVKEEPSDNVTDVSSTLPSTPTPLQQQPPEDSADVKHEERDLTNIARSVDDDLSTLPTVQEESVSAEAELASGLRVSNNNTDDGIALQCDINEIEPQIATLSSPSSPQCDISGVNITSDSGRPTFGLSDVSRVDLDGEREACGGLVMGLEQVESVVGGEDAMIVDASVVDDVDMLSAQVVDDIINNDNDDLDKQGR